jgi:hypothetical protein
VGLMLGAVVGAFARLSHHAIALAMSVGAGLLLAAASGFLAAVGFCVVLLISSATS